MPETRSLAAAGLALRRIEEADLDFLYTVYAASRRDEMAMLADWTDAQKDTFLRDQFRLQHHHYRTSYPDARFDVVEHRGEPIGRLYVAPMANEIRLMDVALLPAHRGRGIGSTLVRGLLDEAGEAGKLVTLHVDSHSRARRLYERMGFVTVRDVGLHELMRWTPPGRAAEGHACAAGSGERV